MNLLQRLIRLVGIDKSIAYTTGAQAVGAVGGFVTSMFILWCLTKEEQDYYYTFKSVMALQVFFNVGVVSGLLPPTGISLPFFSYGGTALLLQLFEMGIILSISRWCVNNDSLGGKKA